LSSHTYTPFLFFFFHTEDSNNKVLAAKNTDKQLDINPSQLGAPIETTFDAQGSKDAQVLKTAMETDFDQEIADLGLIDDATAEFADIEELDMESLEDVPVLSMTTTATLSSTEKTTEEISIPFEITKQVVLTTQEPTIPKSFPPVKVEEGVVVPPSHPLIEASAPLVTPDAQKLQETVVAKEVPTAPTKKPPKQPTSAPPAVKRTVPASQPTPQPTPQPEQKRIIKTKRTFLLLICFFSFFFSSTSLFFPLSP
jgi:hypothetical protein